MAYSQPARTATRWSRPTAYRARRRPLLLGVVLVLLLAHRAGSLLNDTGHVRMPTARTHDDAQDADNDESVVAVHAGEQLTERQLLEAVLIPSGNNIAQLLANVVAGSETRFLAEMNAEARALGMDHTTYTDPSGFDPGTVSTAADQLRVFQQAMRFPVFRQIVSTVSVTLPVAGTVTNYNPLIADGYAGKTGSDSAAGGCLAFFTQLTAGGRSQTAVGVVLGQGQGSDTSALLTAAGEAAAQLVESIAPAIRVRTVAAPVPVGGQGGDAGRTAQPLLPTPGAGLAQHCCRRNHYPQENT